MISTVPLGAFCDQFHKISLSFMKNKKPLPKTDKGRNRFVVPPFFGRKAKTSSFLSLTRKTHFRAAHGCLFSAGCTRRSQHLRRSVLCPIADTLPVNAVYFQSIRFGFKFTALQSRANRGSPRSRPWISTSAVAMFVATGMLFRSQRRSRFLSCGSSACFCMGSRKYSKKVDLVAGDTRRNLLIAALWAA